MNNSPTILPIMDTIKEGWHAVDGAKSTIWAGIFISFLITFCLGIVASIIGHMNSAADMLLRPLIQFVAFLMQMGMLYIGIKRARGEPINYKLIFYAFDGNIMIRLIGVYLLQILFVLAPIALFLVGTFLPTFASFPGVTIFAIIIDAIAIIAFFVIYIRMTLSMGFVLDKLSSPMLAIKQSFEATRNSVWQLIGLFLLQTLIIVISAIPLGIGLIWTLPLCVIIYGMIYKKLIVNVQTA